MINVALVDAANALACAPDKAEASIALYNSVGDIGVSIRAAALHGDAEALDAVARGLARIAGVYRCKTALRVCEDA